MNTKLATVLFLLSFCQLSIAQSTYFDNLYGQAYLYPNTGNTILIINDKYIVGGNGNFYSAPCFNSSIDFFTIDANGNLDSSRSYSNNMSEFQHSQFLMTSDSGYVFATTRENCMTPSYGQIALLKLNSAGDSIWSKNVMLGTSNDIERTSNGNFIIAGSNFYNDGVQIISDFLLIELDSMGTILWDTTYGSTTDLELAVSVEVTDSNLMFFGTVRDSTSAYSDIYMLSTDLNGVLQWDKRIVNPNEIALYGSVSTSDGNYLLYGLEYSSLSNNRQAYFIKVDATGNTIWERSYGDTAFESVYDVKELSNGDFIVAGTTWSEPITSSGFLLKLNSNGDSLWLRNYVQQISGINRFNSIQPTPDGGFVVTGEAYEDMWLLKLDSNGCEILNCLTGVEENNAGLKSRINIYPNPTSGGITIAGLPQGERPEILVYNTLGELVFNQSDAGKIDISDLAPGLYLIEVLLNSRHHSQRTVKY